MVTSKQPNGGQGMTRVRTRPGPVKINGLECSNATGVTR